MKTAEFWTWFQQNEWEIRCAIMAKDEKEYNVICRLFEYLNYISPDLTCELRHLKRENIFIITISCWGNCDAFLMVETLVEAAPKIANWKIKAFIEPEDDSSNIFFTPYPLFSWNIIPNTIKFAIYNYDLDREIYEVLLLLPLFFCDKEEERITEYFYNMFLDIWGEKFVGRRINDVYFTFNEDRENYFFLEIEDLHFLLNNFKSVMEFED